MAPPQVPPFCLQDDLSQTPRYLDIKRRHEEYLQPSKNQAVDFGQIAYSPDGKSLAGVALICKELKGTPPTRVAILNVENGDLKTFNEVGAFDIQPKWSPDGKVVSFLSEIDGYCQLHLLDVATSAVQKVTNLTGAIEKQYWSQDGKSILLTVAGSEADKSGSEGGIPLVAKNQADAEKSWMPVVEAAVEKDAYRKAWVYDVSSGACTQVSPEGLNVWHAVWISNTAVAGICSDLPGEEEWYRSSLRMVDIATKTTKVLFTSPVQMEGIRASPSGAKVAVLTGVASDRQVMKGDVYIADVASGKSSMADTRGVSASCVEWASDDDIIAVGSRETDEMVVHHNLSTGQTRELWSSPDHSIGDHFMAEVAAVKTHEVKCAFVRYGWFNPPTVVGISGSGTTEVKTFSSPQLRASMEKLGTGQVVKWKAPDGLEIYGHFLAPRTAGPHPTVMIVHGGPVWAHMPRYIGANGQILLEQALLAEGIAIFKPNVRGSYGRGQEFAKLVYGDMGGVDTYDYLSGLDALIENGQADANRLGVCGTSYGGFMSSWLITQTDRFAASVPVSPVTDWVSFMYTTNIGKFAEDFLNDDPHDPTGRFFTRSPLQFTRNVKTATLNVCGEMDKCTPPGQAIEFHRALVAHGKAPSVLLSYPEEGHGIRLMPAFFDFAARTVEWFKYFLQQ